MIKTMSGVLAIGFAAVSLTACAGMEGGSPKPDMVMTQMGSAAPGVQVLEEERCSMKENQGLVGKNLNTLPATLAQRSKVIPSNAPAQSDFTADRLTIVYDASNNMITNVKCG